MCIRDSPKTLAAMKDRDDPALIQLIRDQAKGGAEYLDINTAMLGEAEPKELLRVVGMAPVSYTHLDVYKRQAANRFPDSKAVPQERRRLSERVPAGEKNGW